MSYQRKTKLKQKHIVRRQNIEICFACRKDRLRALSMFMPYSDINDPMYLEDLKHIRKIALQANKYCDDCAKTLKTLPPYHHPLYETTSFPDKRGNKKILFEKLDPKFEGGFNDMLLDDLNEKIAAMESRAKKR